MANRPSSVDAQDAVRPLHIGRPISDSSTDGEDDQIHQLNEEHGIEPEENYPEVDVPPKDEEDEPVRGLDDEPDPPDLPEGYDEPDPPDLPEGYDDHQDNHPEAADLEDYEQDQPNNNTGNYGAPQTGSAFAPQLEDFDEADQLGQSQQTIGEQPSQEDEVSKQYAGEPFHVPEGPPPPYDIGGDSPEQNPLAEEDVSDLEAPQVLAQPFANESEKSLWGESNLDDEQHDDPYSRQVNQPLDDDDLNGLEHKPIATLEPMSSFGETMDDKGDADAQAQAAHNRGRDGEQGEGSEEDYSEGEPHAVQGAYDANQFTTLPVGSDVKEVFQFIDAYHPQTVEIEPMLKPFILDFIPAVGDIDAFIKIPRPDEVEDNLGLLVLDEPSAKQSDPTILDLQMRAITKEGAPKDTVVKRLERADKNSKEIEQWITNIGELHRSKPATNVHYVKPMPDIELLMQEWPAEVEAMLKRIELPSADMDVSLEQYVDIVMNFLDIPVHKSRIQSLHVFFTLYSEFKNSQHFRKLAEKNDLDNDARDEPEPDRLVL